MKVFKRFTILFFLLFIYVLICATSYTNAVCKNISDSVFRLHVIANSNSSEDQNLKYLVRDNILKYINSITKDLNDKNEIIEIVSNNLNNFKQIAQDTVYENGFDYEVTVEIGNFDFPVKTYGDISFPPGNYDALRIKIGNASGENWWCVMFPPLCFIDVSSGIVPDDSKEILESELSQEEYKLISDSSDNTKIKFKVVELLQNFNFSGIFM
ncbi:MAG: stage II sporulation protein R [Clostridia bacterium]